ncbi:MAG TPA: 50S ribosomal protein L25 [Fibrobacteria bacterium]|jgi:large subunit ribosomal protein L25|nr:50S ribosomal protein L25 [Fibrobacteria bacterium]
MHTFNISANKRPLGTKGTLSSLRREGKVPAVIYGLKGEAETIELVASDLRPVLAHRNALIDLNVGGTVQKAMLKQLDRDPIRGDYLHADFLRVDDTHPVTVTVPVVTEGIPVGVKTGGGVFSVAKKFVRLRAKVQDIPDTFTIDVSDLKNGVTFYVKDLQFDKGTFVTPPRTALFGVGEGRKEEAAATTAAPAAAAAAPAAGDKKAAAPAAADKKPAAGKK